MKNTNMPQWANDLQTFFNDLENGVYGESIKNAFKKESRE